MGSNSDDFKEVKWSINSHNSQLYSGNYSEAETDDGKYPDSSDKEVNHEKRHSSNKRNPALTRKGGLMKNRIIDHNSSWPYAVFNVVEPH